MTLPVVPDPKTAAEQVERSFDYAIAAEDDLAPLFGAELERVVGLSQADVTELDANGKAVRKSDDAIHQLVIERARNLSQNVVDQFTE